MLDFQQKRKIRNMAYNRTTLIVLFILVLILGHSTWGVYSKKRSSERMKNVSFKNVEELRKKNKELTYKIERLDTVSGIEEEIRLKYNVAKDGESVVVIVDNEKKEVATTTTEANLWQKIKNIFVND